MLRRRAGDPARRHGARPDGGADGGHPRSPAALHAGGRPTRAPRQRLRGMPHENGWADAKFDHARTGFPLVGAHEKVPCQACHPRDYGPASRTPAPAATAIATPARWGCTAKAVTSTALARDAFRRRRPPHHGVSADRQARGIPCQECHGDLRDRSFSRAPLACVDCHRARPRRAPLDRPRRRALRHHLPVLPHDLAFFPARFPAHDACFCCRRARTRRFAAPSATRAPPAWSSPAPAARRIRPAPAATRTAARAATRTSTVMGYSCIDQKCYQCHLRSVP